MNLCPNPKWSDRCAALKVYPQIYLGFFKPSIFKKIVVIGRIKETRRIHHADIPHFGSF